MTWIDSARVAHTAQLPDTELPRGYRGLTLDGVPHASLRNTAMEYLEDFWTIADRGAAPGFFGRSGSFKTWAASVVADIVSDKAMLPTLYIQCGPEFSYLERRRFDDRIEARLEAIRTVPFLVLDDITDVRPTTIAMDMLDGVVKQRDANRLPTLYTGNALFTPKQPDALIQQFGAAMTRRIIEGTTGYLVVLR